MRGLEALDLPSGIRSTLKLACSLQGDAHPARLAVIQVTFSDVALVRPALPASSMKNSPRARPKRAKAIVLMVFVARDSPKRATEPPDPC
jgi:hypothetical protein